MDISTLLEQLLEGKSLNEEEAGEAISAIMNGNLSNEKIAALLTAFRCKGETVDEIAGAAKAMRAHAAKITTKHTGVLDTCGTGGDRSGTINISTAAALIVSAAGVPTAKHGNRSASSQCGSIDLLEQLGVNVNLTPERISACLDELGLAILFARVVHPAMKFAGPVRTELGFRTIFNFLGPLTNPAFPDYQLIGVSNPAVQEMYASCLQRLGIKKGWVVSGEGLDEITLTGVTRVFEVTQDSIRSFDITPEEAGLKRCQLADLQGGTPVENANIVRGILTGEVKDAKRDAVLMNSGAALFIAGKANSLRAGVELAAEAVDSNKAFEMLIRLIRFTNE